jgi:hypothetical protein
MRGGHIVAGGFNRLHKIGGRGLSRRMRNEGQMSDV